MSSAVQLSNNVPQTFAHFITNAFTIVAALAWSDALSGFFKRFAIFKKHPFAGPFLYASLLTLIAYAVWRTLNSAVKTLAAPSNTPTTLMPQEERGSS